LIDQIAALTCLAQVAFMEARGEPVAGQTAVMMVLYRRAEFKPERICSEMAKPYQFSWYGKLKPPERDDPKLKPFIHLAKLVYKFKVQDTSKGAYHFHEINLKPKPVWAIQKPVRVTINNHIFY
jgi:hypothetical protein